MGIAQVPSDVPKTRRLTTLTSGTSWTVPAGVTFVNVTLRGGGGGSSYNTNGRASGGEIVTSTLSTTPGGSITYAIGAGGTAGTSGTPQAGDGGTTTFTGATSAVGGDATTYAGGESLGTSYLSADNGAAGRATGNGLAGGAGSIDVEYWV
jgi:hypothetical protein